MHQVSYEKLIAYAAGELVPDEFDAIGRHVRICDKCAATVAHYHSIRSILRSDDSLVPPRVTLERAQAIFSSQRVASPRQAVEIHWSILARLRKSFGADLHQVSFEKLLAYAAGELSADEHGVVSLHVRECA